MEDLIASTKDYTFEFEAFLEQELGLYLNERKSKLCLGACTKLQ